MYVFHCISEGKLTEGMSTVCTWANAGDVEEVEERLARIKADLLSELTAVLGYSPVF